MVHIPKSITKHKRLIVILFTVVAAVSILGSLQVSVNYNMADYLPKDSQSTIALKIMDAEFSQAVPNARVMINSVSLTEALEYKQKLKTIKGVSGVLWLDDVIDLKEPVELADQTLVFEYYKDNTALFSVTIKDDYEAAATESIYNLIGEDNAMAGEVASLAASQRLAFSESMKAFLILVPIILVILLASTESWIEPLLFLSAIGISVLINMGSNIFLDEISFMTAAISPILQMAVSLDYAIFLLHSFTEYRKSHEDVQIAMQLAIKRAFPAIIGSALTTLFGFMALTFMRFRIGSDLGINLAKGIILSFTSVMVFLPALTLCCYKIIDRTRHRTILPNFTKSGHILLKLKIPCLVLLAVIIVPCFLAQSNNRFIYGFGSVSQETRAGRDQLAINDKFGQSTAIVLLVPKGDTAKEFKLCEELKSTEHVTQVISYTTMVGAAIPADYLDKDITGEFYSEYYCRIILYTDTPDESDVAFAVVNEVQNKAERYYGSNVYSCGQSANLLDMKNVIEADTGLVNLIAVLAIGLVLLFTFRSLSLPLILLFTIEAAIWINLSVPYFYDNSICYLGFLVINTVQLGATVDYAILLTDHYRELRKERPKKEAMVLTYGETFPSILISAVILSSAGFVVAYTSTNPIVSDLGILLGRGTLLSMGMVILVLPTLLLLLDPVIEKTTLRADSHKEKA